MNEAEEFRRFTEQVKRIKKLNLLIKSETTGTLEELAEKFKVSESVIKEDIELMNERDAGIIYDEDVQSYSYTIPGEFFIGWMSAEDEKKREKEKELKKKMAMPERVETNRFLRVKGKK